MELAKIFDNTPAERFRLNEKRSGIYQLIAPLFHEDGDMMSIYLTDNGDGNIKLSDEGMSLMRLSYTFDIDSENKEKILARTIAERHAENDDGNISMVVSPERIYPGIMEYSQLINTVCNLDVLSRENVTNLFYDNLSTTMEKNFLEKYPYKRDATLPGYSDFKIDYLFDYGDSPLCLFGVKDTNKAQQVTICCYAMRDHDIAFRSAAVFEDIDNLTKFSRNSLLNCIGKTFANIDGLLHDFPSYLEGKSA